MSKVLVGIVGFVIIAAGVAFVVMRRSQSATPADNSGVASSQSTDAAAPGVINLTTPEPATPEPAASTSTAVTANPTPKTTTTTTTTTQGTTKVSYTDTGFSPATVTIKAGSTVKFTNNSSQSMWVASDPHPIHNGLAGFDERASVEKGGTYSFTFSKAGTFGYHNHLNPSDTGTVIVE